MLVILFQKIYTAFGMKRVLQVERIGICGSIVEENAKMRFQVKSHVEMM